MDLKTIKTIYICTKNWYILIINFSLNPELLNEKNLDILVIKEID